MIGCQDSDIFVLRLGYNLYSLKDLRERVVVAMPCIHGRFSKCHFYGSKPKASADLILGAGDGDGDGVVALHAKIGKICSCSLMARFLGNRMLSVVVRREHGLRL